MKEDFHFWMWVLDESESSCQIVQKWPKILNVPKLLWTTVSKEIHKSGKDLEMKRKISFF